MYLNSCVYAENITSGEDVNRRKANRRGRRAFISYTKLPPFLTGIWATEKGHLLWDTEPVCVLDFCLYPSCWNLADGK